jgi:hypothetical protein
MSTFDSRLNISHTACPGLAHVPTASKTTSDVSKMRPYKINDRFTLPKAGFFISKSGGCGGWWGWWGGGVGLGQPCTCSGADGRELQMTVRNCRGKLQRIISTPMRSPGRVEFGIRGKPSVRVAK